MGNPNTIFPLFLIIQCFSESQPDIVLKTDGKICLLASLDIKLFDGNEEIVIPGHVKPEGTCYKNGEFNPEIVYSWPNGEIQNSVVIRWKYEDRESYVNFMEFVVRSEKTGEFRSASFSGLHELNAVDGYRWQCNELTIVRNKTEPTKYISLSGIYQIGENLTPEFSKKKSCNENKTEDEQLDGPSLITKPSSSSGGSPPSKRTSSTKEPSTNTEPTSSSGSSSPSTLTFSSEGPSINGNEDQVLGWIKLEDDRFQVIADLQQKFAEDKNNNNNRISNVNKSGNDNISKNRDNTVPIAVGATVAALAIIVVGGFIFQRYKGKKKFK